MVLDFDISGPASDETDVIGFISCIELRRFNPRPASDLITQFEQNNPGNTAHYK